MSETKLKLSRGTIEALTNLSTVNNSIRLDAGNVVVSMSPGRDVIARVGIPDELPESVPIYEGLKELLALLKLFDDPEIRFRGTNLVVRQGRNSQTFRYAAPDLFGTDNNASVRVPNGDPADREIEYVYDFQLTTDEMDKIKKAAAITGAPHFVVRTKGDTNQLEAVCTDKDNPDSTNEYSVELGSTSDIRDTQVAFLIANMKMIPGDYEVRVRVSSEKGTPISHWHRASTADGADFQYWVAVSADERKL